MDKTEILNAARAEAARMQAVAQAADPAGEVRMGVAQFGRLGALIAALATLGEGQESPVASPHAGPGNPRYWVPLPEFARLKARHEALCRQTPGATPGLDDLHHALWKAA